MKGDLILLGITGIAIIAIPLAVTAGGAGQADMGQLYDRSSTVAVDVPGGSELWAAAQPQYSQPEQSQPQAAPPESRSAAQKPDDGDSHTNNGDSHTNNGDSHTNNGDSYKLEQSSFRILNRSTGKVEELSVRDYVRGAIAAEMPASFHTEALKAQGVAALTYACYHARQQRQNPDPLLLGGDFSADPENREGYMTEKQAKKFYGDNKDYNWNKVCKAADEAIKHIILYDGEPIAAAYHAISAGDTEASENIWGRAMPGLRSVDSSWDVLAKGYKSTVTLSQSEIKEKLKDSGAVLLPNPDSWFAVEETSDAGYVTKVQVGSQTMTGNQLRNLLGLRSSSFRIERQGKDFIFYVVGYGHGAGLSQNGADYMARQGKDFAAILEHYYTGCTVAKTA